MAGDLVISLAEAKLFLRVDGDDEDSVITAAILAAQNWVELKTVLILTRRVVVQSFDGFDGPLAIRAWPVVSVDQINYFDPSGTAQQVGQWWASLAARPVRIAPAIGTRWPLAICGSGAVTVTMTVGFESAGDIPPLALQALRMLVAHFYTNRVPVEVGLRAAAIEVPLSITEMLTDWRRRVL